MIHFGDEVEAVLRTLPATGAFFPKLRKLNSGHRATEFTRVCRRAGVHGVTREGLGHAGIILFRRVVPSVAFGELARLLVEFWREAADWDWADRIEYLPGP